MSYSPFAHIHCPTHGCPEGVSLICNLPFTVVLSEENVPCIFSDTPSHEPRRLYFAEEAFTVAEVEEETDEGSSERPNRFAHFSGVKDRDFASETAYNHAFFVSQLGFLSVEIAKLHKVLSLEFVIELLFSVK